MKPILRWHFLTFRRWFVQFRAWKFSLKDSFRSGRLSSTNRSREKSEVNRVFAKQFNTSYTSFMQHFHEHKKLSRLSHCVSHITVSQFNQRMARYLSLNSRQNLEWSSVMKSGFSIIVFSENDTRKPELHAKTL